MTDWRSCSVVRDRDGDLWTNYAGMWHTPEMAPLSADNLAKYDPTPVLDADGLPVVHTPDSPHLPASAAERDEITGESAGVGTIPADVARCVRLWAERFRTGDVWDIEDARDLEFALNGTVASAEVVRSRRRHFARVAAVLDWSSVTRYGEADADELLARLDEIDARSTRA